MFCMKCGKPTEGDQTLCPACAAKEAVPQQTAPAAEETFQLNTQGSAPKKGKKGLIAAVIAGILVLAVALAVILNLGAIKSFFNRTFSSPEDYLISVEQDALTGYAEVVTNAYGSFMDSVAASPEGNCTSTELHVLLGNELLSLAQSALATQGMDMELDWLSDIMLTVDTTQEEEKTQYDIALGLGSSKALTLSMLYDFTEAVIYMGIPELSTTYLQADISDAMGGMSYEDLLAENQQMLTQFQEAMPAEEELQELIVKYLDVVLSKISTVEKSTATITAGGMHQKLTALTTTVSESEFYDICLAILNTAKEDGKLEKIVEKLMAFNYPEAYGFAEEELTALFQNALDEAISTLEASKANVSPENYLRLVTYVDNTDAVVGRILTVNSEGMDAPLEVFRYTTVSDGDAFAFEAAVAQLQIIGSGTDKNDLLNATYSLVLEDTNYISLQIEDLDSKKLDDGYLCGTFRLVPSQDLSEQILPDTDLPVGILGDVAPALELKLDNAGTVELRVLVDSRTLLGLTLASKLTDSQPIQMPTDAADIDDEEAVMNWVSGLDFAGAIQKLKDAGLPEELAAYLEAYAALLSYYI